MLMEWKNIGENCSKKVRVMFGKIVMQMCNPIKHNKMKTVAINPATKLISTLAAQNIHSDHFYLTGFEGMCIEAAHTAMCEAVISSVVPFDREILVVGSGARCTKWRSLCHKLDIAVSALDCDTEENLLEAMEAVLTANTHISHVMCSAESCDNQLDSIGKMVRKFRRSFIVDNDNDAVTMTNINKFNIDFLITAAADEVENPISLIVARRSKLVQTEGIARSASHDIYAMWQATLGVRRPTLEPMIA